MSGKKIKATLVKKTESNISKHRKGDRRGIGEGEEKERQAINHTYTLVYICWNQIFAGPPFSPSNTPTGNAEIPILCQCILWLSFVFQHCFETRRNVSWQRLTM